MTNQEQQFERPHFDDALKAWRQVLGERGLPAECLWIFDENLCFEPDAAVAGGFRLGYQLKFSPPPADAERLTYGYFSDFDCRLVFYRVGSSQGKSVCLMLCDQWFESKGEAEGYLKRDDWRMSFRPGAATEIEEIVDATRWQKRIVRDRPLHDLDFCMALRSVHEILAHGRVLTSYEHYALRFLHLWERFFKHG